MKLVLYGNSPIWGHWHDQKEKCWEEEIYLGSAHGKVDAWILRDPTRCAGGVFLNFGPEEKHSNWRYTSSSVSLLDKYTLDDNIWEPHWLIPDWKSQVLVKHFADEDGKFRTHIPPELLRKISKLDEISTQIRW